MSISKAVLAGLAASQVASALTPCGSISQIISSSNNPTLSGPMVHDCLTSVPIKQDDATAFLKKYRSTLEFQSNTAWLKNPPSSYKQPATDIMGGLDMLDAMVGNGSFTNQYDFEAALQGLLQSSHDGHLFLQGGLTAVFSFSLPLLLASVSSDGTSLPKPYSLGDIVLANQASDSSWTPSAMQTINGEDAVTWLTDYAATYASGYLEPHVDWNNLFFGVAGSVVGGILATNFNNRYPGDWFNVTFENGTAFSGVTTASLLPASFDVTSGEDVYERFVAAPQVTSTAAPSAAATAAPTGVTSDFASPTTVQGQPTSWFEVKHVNAFPKNPDIVQPNLGHGGYLTGYFYPDQSLAVMSLPSFNMVGVDAQTFSASVNEFITKAKQNNLKKVLIDVQSNGGGDALLSTELFKNFFPTITPFSGSRMRAHDTANVLGDAYTGFFLNSSIPVDDRNQILAEPWTAPTYDNAQTGQPFASWEELSQNYTQNGDLFTITLRDNLTNALFDLESTSFGIVVDGFANRTNEPAQPYDASDIAVLLDGQCASTCTTFAEMFHREGGVKLIAVGGRPEYGPMQAIGGVRGAQSYSQQSLNKDIRNLLSVMPSLASQLPDTNDVYQLSEASFNLRDQIRPNESFPLQFAYEPADCRIFYTPQTVDNYANLWLYAANAIWGNGTCVQGSTGVQSSYGNATDVSGPNGTSEGGSSSGGSPTGGAPAPTPTNAAAAARVGGMGWALLVLLAGFVTL